MPFKARAGLVVKELLQDFPDECVYWRTHNGISAIKVVKAAFLASIAPHTLHPCMSMVQRLRHAKVLPVVRQDVGRQSLRDNWLTR